QQKVIDAVLAGQSCAAIFPTGAGKSLCYQLPALHLPHLTLVISPLLALMKDQLNFLHDKEIAAASI
ncbi:DEAD/DEAH box helicase, partial [Vibrio sp. 10N.261.55.A7]